MLDLMIINIAKRDVSLIKNRGKVKKLATGFQEVLVKFGMSASLSTIEAEIRRYRKEHGYPIKKYIREPSLR